MIFGRGMKLFSIILWGYKNFKSNSYGVQSYFLKQLWMKSSIKAWKNSLETSGNDESLNQCENRLGQLAICHISMLYAQGLLDGGTKPFC